MTQTTEQAARPLRVKLPDGSSWPLPDGEDDDRPLGWTLTYGTPTREDLLRAVSILNAYDYMTIHATKAKRDMACRAIRAEVSR